MNNILQLGTTYDVNSERSVEEYLEEDIETYHF